MCCKFVSVIGSSADWEVPVFCTLILRIRTPSEMQDIQSLRTNDRKLQGGCHEQHRFHASSQSAQHCDGVSELPECSWARVVVRELRAERAVCVRHPSRAAQADPWRRVDSAFTGSD